MIRQPRRSTLFPSTTLFRSTSMAMGRSKARRGAMGKPLELDRQADLDDLHWRQAVVVAHGAGVAAEQRIEALLPLPHLRVAIGDDHLAVEIVGGLVELHRHAGRAHLFHEVLEDRKSVV